MAIFGAEISGRIGQLRQSVASWAIFSMITCAASLEVEIILRITKLGEFLSDNVQILPDTRNTFRDSVAIIILDIYFLPDLWSQQFQMVKTFD